MRCRHVALKLRLVRAQLRLGVLDAVRHGIEGLGELGDSRRSCRAVRAARSPAARRRVAAVRRRTGTTRCSTVSSTETRSSRPSTAAALVRRVFGDFGGGRGVLCGLHQAQARRLLQLLLDRADERGALQQVALGLAAGAVVARNPAAGAPPGKVLAQQRQPRAPRDTCSSGAFRSSSERKSSSRRAMTAALSGVPADRIDAGLQFRQRAAPVCPVPSMATPEPGPLEAMSW